MKKLTFTRLGYSKYFTPEFKIKEINKLKSFGEFNPIENKHCDIAITNTDINIEQLWLDGQFQHTKLIIHPNSGHDNFSQRFIEESNIPVILGNPIRENAVVNYILGAFFESLGKTPWVKEWDKSRNWERRDSSRLKGLIIGYGHIGRKLEKCLLPLMEKIFIYDPFQNFSILESLSEIDYIFICAGLNSTSENLINNSFLSRLKSSVCLINPARGKIINLNALIEFLSSNSTAKAYLDVYPEEPYPLEKLSHLKNLYLSSHVAGVYENLEENILNFEEEVIQHFILLSPEEFKNKYKFLLLNNKIINGQLI